MKPLVLMVEGDADSAAVPGLINRLMRETEDQDALFVDGHCIKGQTLGRLVKDDYRHWLRMLGVAKNRGDLGAVLLLLDGDSRRFLNEPFCPVTAARSLASAAARARAGSLFSVAVVFACREYESWLIAGIESLEGKPLGHDRARVPAGLHLPDGDLEQSPRDAKGWLRSAIGVYSETLDQASLTRAVDLDLIHQRMRSFRRLRSAVHGLVRAAQSGQSIATPAG